MDKVSGGRIIFSVRRLPTRPRDRGRILTKLLEVFMIYLIEPNAAKPVCLAKCTAFCHIKPLYGIPTDTI
jgi:hypothetical protein